jgi:glycosyltransferase involved in cell wall biosynthesis
MSDSAELISVVIPCFNQAHFLPEAIRSVQEQTYQKTEICVVDDGSTDATSAVASRYPNVRVIRQRNQFTGAARNAGARASTGNYLVFLDADDRLLPRALEIGMRYLASQAESAFVSGRCRYIAEDGSFIAIPEQQVVRQDHYLELLFRNYIWCPANVLFRRYNFEEVGGFRTFRNIRGAEDYDLYLRIARRFSVFCHGAVVSDYRQYDLNGGNVSRNVGRMLRATLTALRDQRPYLKGNEHYELQYRRGIQHKRMFWGNLAIRDLTSSRQPPIGGMLHLLRNDPVTLFKFLSERLSRSGFRN